MKNKISEEILGHKYGNCVITQNIILLYIPKNASTTIINSLSTIKFRPHQLNYFNLTDKQLEGKEIVAVLREPIDRLVSNYVETKLNSSKFPYFYKSTDYISLNPLAQFQLYLDTIIKKESELCKKQYLYLQDIPIEYYLNFHNLNNEFITLCSKINHTHTTNLPFTNKRAEKSPHKRLQKSILEYIDNNKNVKEQLQTILYKDYELYNKIK